MEELDVFRTVSTCIGPDRGEWGSSPSSSTRQKPGLVYGSDIARSEAWEAGIRFAEKMHVQLGALRRANAFPREPLPLCGGAAGGYRSSFRQAHRHDIVVSVRPVFRYYPFVPGQYLSVGTRLLQVTDDCPGENAEHSWVGLAGTRHRVARQGLRSAIYPGGNHHGCQDCVRDCTRIQGYERYRYPYNEGTETATGMMPK